MRYKSVCIAVCIICCFISRFSHAGMADCVNDVDTKPLATPSNEHPIRKLLYCANVMMGAAAPFWVEFARNGKSECSSALRESQSLASECADERIVAAVESAKDKEDLRTAIKDYYIKQKAFVAAWGPSSGQTMIGYKRDLSRAQADADAAWDKVRLEGKLAGIDLEPKKER